MNIEELAAAAVNRFGYLIFASFGTHKPGEQADAFDCPPENRYIVIAETTREEYEEQLRFLHKLDPAATKPYDSMARSHYYRVTTD